MIPLPPILEHQLQHERMTRAQAALQRGEMQVIFLTGTPHAGATWLVASKGSRYTVSLDGNNRGCHLKRKRALDRGRGERHADLCGHIQRPLAGFGQVG